MKEDLEKQYQEWQEVIVSRKSPTAKFSTTYVQNKIKIQDDILKVAILKSGDEKVKQELTLLIDELKQFKIQLNEKHQNFVNFANNIINEQQ